MRAPWGTLHVVAGTAALTVLAGSCSFTTATGFVECSTDVQCGSGRVCLQSYCISLPERCERLEGAFDKPDRIPIAAILPLTETPDGGAQDDSEVMGLNAMRLALGEVNGRDGIQVKDGGQITGRHFALFSCNTGRDRDVLTQQVKWFVDEMGVPVVLTSGSSQTIAAAQEPSRFAAGTMIMSATSTSPELVDVFRLDHSVWRTAPPDTLQALVLAQLLRTEPTLTAARNIGVIYEKSAYGEGLAFAVRDAVTRDGKSAKVIPYTVPVDANGVLNDLVPFAPHVTVIVGFPSDVRAIISAAKLRPSLTRTAGHQWMLTDSAKDPAIVDATTRSELLGTFGTAPAQGAGSAFPTFVDVFKTRFHVDPNDYSFTSHSYDAMYLVMLSAAYATSTGSVTGRAMSDGMAHVSSGPSTYQLLSTQWIGASNAIASGASIDVEGSSGKLDFDLDAGAPSAPYEVWQVADAGFTTLRLITP